MIKIFAVVYANFYPLEIDSLWTTKELAEICADNLGNMWRVREMEVKGEVDGDTEDRDTSTNED